jgi:Sulfotransferase domain
LLKNIFPQAKSIEALKELLNINSEDAKFMRKGQTGSWKREMTEEQVERIRQWEERQLKDTDLTFQYE